MKAVRVFYSETESPVSRYIFFSIFVVLRIFTLLFEYVFTWMSVKKKTGKLRMAIQHPQTSGWNDSSKLKLLFHLGSWDYLPSRKKKQESGEKCWENKVLKRDKTRQNEAQIKSLLTSQNFSLSFLKETCCVFYYLSNVPSGEIFWVPKTIQHNKGTVN